jgi:hypothetical protein
MLANNPYNLDAIVSAALAGAALEDGVAPGLVASRYPDVAWTVAGQTPGKRKYNAPWTEQEDNFLRQYHGILSEGEIARRLGRSTNGVHIRSERHLRLPRPSKDRRYLTLNQVARILGVDNHKTTGWHLRGLLPAETIPFDSDRLIRRVSRGVFFRWALNPLNWIWFDPERVADPALHKLLARKRQLWGDEWWSTNQVAEYHGVDNKDVLRYIKLGRITAVRAHNRSSRHGQAGWANWFVLRSEATRPGLRFIKRGKGHTASRDDKWVASADAFFLTASAVGLPPAVIARLSGWEAKRIDHRVRTLCRSGQAASIIADQDLPIAGAHGVVWADWRLFRRRFPSVARAMDRFARYLAGNLTYPVRHKNGPIQSELLLVRGVLGSWADYFCPDDVDFRRRCRFGMATPAALARKYAELQARDIDPLGPIEGVDR